MHHTCFLISPFGDKTHQLKGGQTGNYELLREAIQRMIESYPHAEIRMARADDIADVGGIDESFILALYHADIVVAEISAVENANVFYELGIRYALRRGVTIPIYQKGTQLPADLRNVYGVEYDPQAPRLSTDTLHRFIQQRLNRNAVDSPVFKLLPTIETLSSAEVDALRAEIVQLRDEIRQLRIDEKTQIVLDEAEAYFRKGEIHKALDKFKAAYETNQQNMRLGLRYGTLLSKDKRHEDAIKVLTRVVELNQTNSTPIAEPFRELGVAYSRWGKPQLALDWLEKAVALEPNDADAHGIIGGAYKLNYNFDKAIEAYERGFDVDPTSTYCLLNAIILRLIRNQGGDTLKAKRLLNEADLLTQRISSEPVETDIWSLYDRSHVLLLMKKREEALDLFGKALSQTLTIGELDSSQKNINLLMEAEVELPGLNEIFNMYKTKRQELSALREAT